MRKRIGILIFDGVEELEFIGPLEVFGTAERFGANCFVSTISDHSPVVCRHGTRVCVQDQLLDASPLDILIVPGGPGADAASRNAGLLRFVRLPHAIVAPVCAGSIIVAAAGLPANHPLYMDGCSGENAPASAGIEIAIALVERMCTERIASAVASSVYRQPLRRERYAYPAVRGLF